MKPTIIILGALMVIGSPALGHDIYAPLRTKDGTLPCCGGADAGAKRDCWRTIYREDGDRYQFRLNSGDWLPVPLERIQFTPIPGDPPNGEAHEAHLCYRDDEQTLETYHEHDNTERILKTITGAEVVVYCAIVPPGGT